MSALAFAAHGAIAAATDSGIFVSLDKGSSWQRAGAGPGAVLGLAYAERVLLAGLEHHGVSRSADDGATWRAATTGLEADVPTALAVAADGTLYVATLEAGVRRSPDAGATWLDSNAGLEGATVLGLATLDRTVYAATSDGVFTSQGGPWRLDGRRLETRQRGRQRFWTGRRGLRRRRGAHISQATSWRSLDVPFTGAVTSLAVAPDGTTFVGTRQASGEFVLVASVGALARRRRCRRPHHAIGHRSQLRGRRPDRRRRRQLRLHATARHARGTRPRTPAHVAPHRAFGRDWRSPLWLRPIARYWQPPTPACSSRETRAKRSSRGTKACRQWAWWRSASRRIDGVYAAVLGGAVWRRAMPDSR